MDSDDTVEYLKFYTIIFLINNLFLISNQFLGVVGNWSFITQIAQEKHDALDPSWIVIDEVIGMSIAWLFIQDHNIYHLVILFCLFRFFDIFKIEPVRYIDKNLKHGSGVILDDVVAGLYAGLTYKIIQFFEIIP